jgi:hypothetical protein
MFSTTNYLFAAFLQSKEGGDNRIVKVDKLRPGKAKFYFNITPEDAEKFKIDFHNSVGMEFENFRKKTIDLAY